MSSASSQFKKDNHWVPRLYLKRWSADGTTVPTYGLLVPNASVALWKNHSLKGIAYREHLYTYFVGDAATDEFERWLDSEFEQPAALAIDRAINEQKLTPDDWERLVRFAIAQDVRTPAKLKEFMVRQAKEIPTLMQNTLDEAAALLEAGLVPPKSTGGVDTTDLPLQVTFQPAEGGGTTISATTIVGRKLWVWSQRQLLTRTIKQLPTKGWTILRAPTGITWPTSDDPLVRLHYVDSSNYHFAGGWLVPNGDIFMPISPKHLLYTCVGRKPWPRGTVVDVPAALRFRRMIIEHADRFIFAKEPGDIHAVRPRRVSLDAYRHEQVAWKNWHHEQSQAEKELAAPRS